ncbi:HAD-IB family phosphatase [Xanthobacter sp. V0B-10]|uniref:HAD-IB family phosphatase n=1 Tax=Xanthobacter albus TaxID=3119929 RepID=UPI00372A29C7
MQFHFALDFDGTVCPTDTTDLIIEAFAEGDWRQIEQDWRDGRIGSRECLSRQVAMLRADPGALRKVLAGVKLDPDFPAFVTAAWLRGASVSIVSDGFDRIIVPLLLAHGIDLPVTSNRLLPTGADRWTAAFSNLGESCANGTCKCAAVPGNRPVVLVGDGRSDFCLARRADFVLAKGELAAFCAREGIPHRKITGFADALGFLEPPYAPRPRDTRADPRSTCENLHA